LLFIPTASTKIAGSRLGGADDLIVMKRIGGADVNRIDVRIVLDTVEVFIGLPALFELDPSRLIVQSFLTEWESALWPESVADDWLLRVRRYIGLSTGSRLHKLGTALVATFHSPALTRMYRTCGSD
jgi:hypothetical protein